ncbi:MAG: hypothetical protein HC817_03340 [Saprospiraceae bacterium]|nr:hypothetical protein [Saprospiraceae bacterium]
MLTAQLTGDNTLLEPLIETLILIKKYENTEGGASAVVGSEKWVALNLIKETGFWTVVSAWRFWSNDARFDALLKKYGSPYLRFRLTGDESDLAKGYQKMLAHLRVNFPILTNEALFTDRVYLTADDEYDPADYARALLTGDEIQISASPYPSVTWAKCPDDLTVLVSESSPKSLIVKLFSHETKKINATIRLWQLERGAYQITIGNQKETINLTERGQYFSFVVDPSVLQTLAVQKVEN